MRGRSESEAVSKVDREIESYLRWLGVGKTPAYKVSTIQRHNCSLNVEDADNEILLEADSKEMSM